MRISQLVGRRFKERPAEATLESHAFLLRGGYARQLANGIYSLLPPGLRVIHKIENILREEMDAIGAQEILMPVVQPREIWDESGRWSGVGAELCRFKDRTRHDMVLAITHEESTVHLCRNEIVSHNQMPAIVYHIQTKFRDEPRSRGGLIRVREFTMKDAYSFHTSPEDLEACYNVFHRAYKRIFTRAGLPEVVSVQSDTGNIGGKIAHEYILLTEAGEDTIVTSDDGKYLANQEVATGSVEAFKADPLPLEKVHTPGQKTIEDVAAFIGIPARQTAKAVFYEEDSEGKLVLAVVRGDREINENKVAKLIGVWPVAASEEKIVAAGSVPGYASPMGLDPKKVHILIDRTVAESNNLVAGANETEYHVKNFNFERDCPGMETYDLIQAIDGDTAPTGGKIVLKRGIEVGNIFQLGTKYSKSMGMTYLDADGKAQIPLMGCYGIGVGRLMSSIMEVRHDKFGPLWPLPVAPWQVHICAIKPANDGIGETAERLYNGLNRAGIETILDDSAKPAGWQFADADLLGCPIRFIVSSRNLKDGNVEWKRRDTGESGVMPIDEAIDTARQWVAEGLAQLSGQADAIE